MSYVVHFKANNCIETIHGPFDTLVKANDFIWKHIQYLNEDIVDINHKLKYTVLGSMKEVTVKAKKTNKILCKYEIFKLVEQGA